MTPEDARNLIIDKYSDSHLDRLSHTFGVAEMAEFLAKKYNVDVNKALIAAYLHDYCKYDPESDAVGVLSDREITECNKYPFLYHAYLSAYSYRKLGGEDREIFNAIKYHVFGRPHMTKLEEIIMISDYTEKNRRYKACVECREILLGGDLNMAIYKSLESTINYCISRGDKVHPKQLEVFNEYKEKLGL